MLGGFIPQGPKRWVLRITIFSPGGTTALTTTDSFSILFRVFGPNFMKSVYNDTLGAWDPGLGLSGRFLRGSLSRVFRGYF